MTKRDEWVPPTCSERRMFMVTARHFGDAWYLTGHTPACEWTQEQFGDGKTTGYDVERVFESLAIDGLW